MLPPQTNGRETEKERQRVYCGDGPERAGAEYCEAGRRGAARANGYGASQAAGAEAGDEDQEVLRAE